MSGKINSYKDMIVWQKETDLVVNIYAITNSLPDYEKFGLVNQMRRAAVSIPCNIAEGQAQRTKNDYKRYLRMSIGSCNELETQAEISYRLGFLVLESLNQIRKDIIEIRKILVTIVNKIGIRNQE